VDVLPLLFQLAVKIFQLNEVRALAVSLRHRTCPPFTPNYSSRPLFFLVLKKTKPLQV
jgi:hypothetical protein